MSNFVTIQKFTYIQELYVLRTVLEANDIEYQVLDELTAQVIPYISGSRGGIRLQVREEDAERALELLKEKGFIQEEKEEVPSKLYTFIDDFTMKIPGLNELKWEARVLILASIITLLGAIALLYLAPTLF